MIYRVLKRKRFQGRRFIKTKQWKLQRHRRHIEPQSLFANFISNLYTKCLSRKNYQESVRYTSVALCAVGISVTLHYLRPLRDSVCLFYKTFSFTLHIRKNLKNSKTSTQKNRIYREKLSFTQSIRTMSII